MDFDYLMARNFSNLMIVRFSMFAFDSEFAMTINKTARSNSQHAAPCGFSMLMEDILVPDKFKAKAPLQEGPDFEMFIATCSQTTNSENGSYGLIIQLFPRTGTAEPLRQSTFSATSLTQSGSLGFPQIRN